MGNEWVLLTPESEFRQTVYRMFTKRDADLWAVESRCYGTDDVCVWFSDGEALAFAAQLPEVRALVEQARSAHHQLERDASKWEAEAEYYDDAPGLQLTRLTRSRLCQEEADKLNVALRPFEASE